MKLINRRKRSTAVLWLAVGVPVGLVGVTAAACGALLLWRRQRQGGISQGKTSTTWGSVADVSSGSATAAPSVSTTTSTPAVDEATSKLHTTYLRMHEDFSTNNLCSQTISALHPWYHGMNPGEMVWPKRYVDMQPPFPPSTVRLLVIPLESAPGIAAFAATAAARIAALLPPGTKVFSNARSHYHCTIFHTSHPYDPRPDPRVPGGGAVPGQAPHEQPCAAPDVLAEERARVAQVVAATQAPELEVHRVLLARSGTLLLMWTDASGRVADLRQRLRSAFPGCSAKQPDIIHSSLLRVLSADTLPDSTVREITKACELLTLELRGRRFRPPTMWWVNETEAFNLEGERTVLPLAST